MNRKMNGQQAWELDERRDEFEEPTIELVAEVEELAAEALEESPALEPSPRSGPALSPGDRSQLAAYCRRRGRTGRSVWSAATLRPAASPRPGPQHT